MAYENIIKELRDLLEDNVHPELKRPFYYGDPIAIPESSLPTVAIDPLKGETVQGPTGHDEHLKNIIIKVIVDKRKDIGKGGGEVVATQELEKYVEEIDETTGRYKTDTILGILRKNLTLEKTVVDQGISWEYRVAEREDITTEECWITIDTRRIIEVQNRS